MLDNTKTAKLTDELEHTIEKLNSINRKLELLHVSVLKNVDYLNPFDVKACRAMVKDVEDDLDTLSIIDSSVRKVVMDCHAFLDELDGREDIAGVCSIIGEHRDIDINFEELIRRVKFQLESLITSRGVKEFNVEALGSLGHASLEALKLLKEKHDISVKLFAPAKEFRKDWIFDYIHEFDVCESKIVKQTEGSGIDVVDILRDAIQDSKFCLVWRSQSNKIETIELLK